MRAIIQRVKNAKVQSEGKTTGKIGKGLFILLGVGENDTPEDSIWLSNKISNLRIFDDADGKMNLSLMEIKGECLVVSQFTLHAKTKKGNRPSFIKAAKPQLANELYMDFVHKMEILTGENIQTGSFGQHMDIDILADGPVTIMIDTKNKE
ncbi:MAG: D-aminoacyl-tRNA deacylase [Bacteroidales bacterium]